VQDILHAYFLATHYDPGWYKAWHTWALANFGVIAYMESSADSKLNDVAGERLAIHVVQAVKGWLVPILFFFTKHYLCRLLSIDRSSQSRCSPGYPSSAYALVQIWSA
jgi:FAT domain